MKRFSFSIEVIAAVMLIGITAIAAPVVYDDESEFRAAAGPTATYGFETHGLVEETDLASPFSASELDGNFALANTHLNYFGIWGDGSPYVSEGTHYLFTHSQFPFDGYTLTFSDFGGTNAAITAFGLTVIDFASFMDPQTISTITFDTGGLTGNLFMCIGPQPEYTKNFLGLIVDKVDAFTSITLTLNDIDSGFQSFDEVIYSQGQIPEPSTMLLLTIGLAGLAACKRKKLFRR